MKGDDKIHGGDDADWIEGGLGDDKIWGGDDDVGDVIYGDLQNPDYDHHPREYDPYGRERAGGQGVHHTARPGTEGMEPDGTFADNRGVLGGDPLTSILT